MVQLEVLLGDGDCGIRHHDDWDTGPRAVHALRERGDRIVWDKILWELGSWDTPGARDNMVREPLGDNGMDIPLGVCEEFHMLEQELGTWDEQQL